MWKIRSIAEKREETEDLRRKEKEDLERKVRIKKEKIWIQDRWFYWLDKIEDDRDRKKRRRSEEKEKRETDGKKGERAIEGKVTEE